MKTFLPLAAVLVALIAAGCGGDEEEPAAPSGGGGQQLFSDNCANCHTLAAAGASGKVGPDLDQRSSRGRSW